MPEIVQEILVDAPLKILWNLMVQHLKYPEEEAERGPEWEKLVIKDIRGKTLTSKRTGLGVRTKWFYKFHFYSFEWDDEVTEWKEMEKITWKSLSTWDMVDSFTIKPDNTHSRLTYEMRYTPPNGIFGRVWYRLFVHKNLKTHLHYVLLQMKRNAEAIAKFSRRNA